MTCCVVGTYDELVTERKFPYLKRIQGELIMPNYIWHEHQSRIFYVETGILRISVVTPERQEEYAICRNHGILIIPFSAYKIATAPQSSFIMLCDTIDSKNQDIYIS